MKKKRFLGVTASSILLTVPLIALPPVAVANAKTSSTTQEQKATSQTPSVSVQQDVMVPMRDGTLLASDVYLPSTGGPKFPTLIARTPYGKSAMAAEAKYLAARGYAIVIQDVRGRGNSKGFYYPFKDDGPDGYDTIEWAAKQSWSNGKVGTFGASALGIVQNATAVLNPPHLKAMFSVVSTANFYEEAMYQGGALRQSLIQGWLNAQNIEQVQRLLPPDQAKQALSTIIPIAQDFYRYETAFTSSLRDFPYLTQQLMPSYQDMLNMDTEQPDNPSFSPFEANNMMDKLQDIHVPIYHVGGFQDIFEAGVLKSYQSLQHEGGTGAKGNQKLLMGPWTHGTTGSGGANTPWAANAAVNLDNEMVRWFDYWLKGINNHIMQEPSVRYYVTGENAWENGPKWPLPETKTTPFYLNDTHSGTISSLNDGGLSLQKPQKESPDTYLYDPTKPTNTVGGNNLTIPAGPLDQSSIEHNVLTFTSSPLQRDLMIVGPLSALLYVSSNAKDTDFTVKLTDVSPDGTSTLLEDGIIRAKYRSGQDHVVLMEPGHIYPLHVNLIAVSHLFKAGHRIRVDVASSNYPRFDRNTNTGDLEGVDSIKDGQYVVATNTLYHDAQHPSCVYLPVIPGNRVFGNGK